MKYSQAIVVAAVASAAVVSAAPTAHQAGAHGKHTPQGKHASGTKPHLGAALKKAGASALRTAGGAEGAATHLGNLAMMYQSHKQNKAAAAAAASEEPVARAIAADAEAQAPVSAPATPAKASSTHPKEKATGTHDKKTNKSHHRHHPKKQEGKVHHTKESATPSKVTPTTESKVPTTPVATREFFDEEDLFERDLAELEELEARGRLSGIIGKARQAMKGHKMNTAITAASIGATVGTSVGIANSQKQQRDFTDEEFDELVARGKLGSLFSKARSAVKGHKVSGALTALNIGSQLMPQQQQQRDLADEDLELFERDLTDDEFDELVARGKLGALFSKARSAVKGHKVSGALTALNVGAQMMPQQQQQRDLSDEEFDELVARGKLGAIISKVRTGMKGHKMQTGLAAASIGASVGTSVGIANSQKQQQQQRDLSNEEFDELVARGKLGAIINKVRTGMKGHKMQTGLAAASIGASVGTSVGIANSQKQQRDLSDEEFDELVARGKLGSLFSKARSAIKGHKVSGALTALNVGAQMMPQQQQQRDLADEDLDLFERDFTDEEFDELVARGKLGSLFSKARSAVKGHKVSGALTALNVGASLMPQQQQRDLTDEEIYELVARGRLGSLISTARHALKGHKMDAAFTAANVASSIPHKQQPQQRDLEDFDELEMRDFDFEIDELD